MKCVEGATTLTGFFLMSFEMQVKQNDFLKICPVAKYIEFFSLKTTVGFGERYPNEECPEAIFMMIAQIVVGIALDGAMIGIIYAKLTRPPRKPYDLKFSRKAVVCLRDSKLCLMFRVCDPNEIHVVDSKVQACIFGELK